jgi:penicillin-binding protein 1C
MLRQPGSALKPFVYAAALSTGRYTTSTILPDLPVQIVEAGAAFSPANYDQEFHGPVPLRVALASSYNVPAIRIAHELGPFEILQALRHVGFASLGRTPEHYGVGLALGNVYCHTWGTCNGCGPIRAIRFAPRPAATGRPS